MLFPQLHNYDSLRNVLTLTLGASHSAFNDPFQIKVVKIGAKHPQKGISYLIKTLINFQSSLLSLTVHTTLTLHTSSLTLTLPLISSPPTSLNTLHYFLFTSFTPLSLLYLLSPFHSTYLLSITSPLLISYLYDHFL